MIVCDKLGDISFIFLLEHSRYSCQVYANPDNVITVVAGENGIPAITWVCTNSPAAHAASVTEKAVHTCKNWLIFGISEPVAPHQNIEGTAQSDFTGFHLPQLRVLPPI